VSAPDALSAFLAGARERIDKALERSLPAPPDAPTILSEAMRYSLFAGGKRLRPILALAAADAVDRSLHREAIRSGDAPSAIDLALPAACALELIHTYSLIHDDLPSMDNDVLRRGRPTLHVVYGEGLAILAADGLQAQAFAVLAQLPDASPAARTVLEHRMMRVVRVIAEAAGPIGMVGGQAIDLQAAGQAGARVTLDAEGVRAMHARKTGALIRASAVSGAIAAGAAEPVIAAVDHFGTDIGLAFQIVDDILDVEGEAATIGKTIGKDADRAKPTYPALFGLDRSRALAADCLDRARQTIADAGLTAGWLVPIAEWVVSRKS